MQTYDVIVVGGGILGRTIALELARRGMSLALLDTDAPDHRQATQAAGAMLGVFGEVTAEDGPPDTAVDLAARIFAAERYPTWLESLSNCGPAPEIKAGTLVVASAGNHRDPRNIRSIVAALKYHARRHESVDTRELPYLRPANNRPILEAIWIPDEGSVNIVEVMRRLREELDAEPRVKIHLDVANELLGSSNRVTGVATESGVIGAKWVVLAAGIGTMKLLATHPTAAESALPILEGKGTSLILELGREFPCVVRTPNREFACGLHLVPRGRSSVYLGATNRMASVVGATGRARADEVHYLLETAFCEFDTRLAYSDVTSISSGSRPVSADRRPLVGATSLPGLAIATGTYRNGVILAPYIGDLVGQEIEDGSTEAANPFSPIGRRESLAKTTVNVHDVLERASGDLLSILLEPNCTLPYGRDVEVAELFQLLVPLLADSPNPAISRVCQEIVGRFPMEEIVPELLIVLRKQGRSIGGSDYRPSM